MKKIFGLAVIYCLLPALVIADDVWQRDEAIVIVGDLRLSLNNILEMSREDPAQPDAVQSKNAHAAMVDIRFLTEELERLELALLAGKGRAQTFAMYKRISSLRYGVRNYARDIEVSEDARDEAEVAKQLLLKLDLVYF